ncbi:MAG TPA: hypothetical protein VMW64_08145 [Dehalococcoidia bacterium]|nr:hypothetical protein [Dehalococcoidia bacterium]
MVVDLIGVECGSCHEGAFQLVERETLVKVKVCPRCARRIDAGQQEQTKDEMLKALDKVERKRVLKEKSHDWARNWHGKHVVVTYDAGDGRGEIAKKNCHIKGIAWYASKNEDIGWGRVKVVLDDAELHRVIFEQGDIKYYGDEEITRYLIPIVDGYRWGLGCNIISHGCKRELEKPLAFYVNWGDRHAMILEEVDEEAEQQAAIWEAERLRIEQEKEINRHLGEGI